ncbi:MAG: hypothetical protein ACREK2_07395 [Gemmatimonadota bacterium]
MTDHPTLDRLFDAARGRREAAAASDHAAACPSCARSLEWLRNVLDGAAGGPLPDPPEAWIQAALRIPGEIPAVERGASGWTPARLLGALAAPAGVRGAAGPRRSLYEAGDAHLDLEITADENDADTLRVTGQLLVPAMPPASAAIATLWRGEALVAHAAADSAGVFMLPAVAYGTYRLEVWEPGADRAIRVEPLELVEK